MPAGPSITLKLSDLRMRKLLSRVLRMMVACMNSCMRPFRTDDGMKSTRNGARARIFRKIISMDSLVVWKQAGWAVKDPSQTLLGWLPTHEWLRPVYCFVGFGSVPNCVGDCGIIIIALRGAIRDIDISWFFARAIVEHLTRKKIIDMDHSNLLLICAPIYRTSVSETSQTNDSHWFDIYEFTH